METLLGRGPAPAGDMDRPPKSGVLLHSVEAQPPAGALVTVPLSLQLRATTPTRVHDGETQHPLTETRPWLRDRRQSKHDAAPTRMVCDQGTRGTQREWGRVTGLGGYTSGNARRGHGRRRGGFRPQTPGTLVSAEWAIEGGILLFWGKIYVPDQRDLQRRIVAQHYDTQVAGHLGRWKTLEMVACNYWWPQMARFVGNYMKTCDLCLRTKVQR
jgi:Integrase zinc binding domain